MYYIPIGMPEMGVHARGKNRKNNGPKTMNCWTFKFISYECTSEVFEQGIKSPNVSV